MSAQRGPELRRAWPRCSSRVLVLGVFIPVVQATTGAANDVRGRVLVNVYLKTRRQAGDVARVRGAAGDTTAARQAASSTSPRQQAYAAGAASATPRPTSCSAPTRCPDTFRVTPDEPDNVARAPRRARARHAPAAAARPIDPAIDAVKNRKDETHKILVATRVVKLDDGRCWRCCSSSPRVLLISNTIRLSLFSRRREVEVMKLVGATDWFIRWPFVIEGVVLGALGGAARDRCCSRSARSRSSTRSRRLRAARRAATRSASAAGRAAARRGVGVSAAGSGLSLRRFLRV